jgi:hypothetical protein
MKIVFVMLMNEQRIPWHLHKIAISGVVVPAQQLFPAKR